MWESIVCTFKIFLSLVHDSPVSDEGGLGSGSSHNYDSDMLELILSGICKTLEKMGFWKTMHESGVDLSLRRLTYCQSCDAWLAAVYILTASFRVQLR